MKALAVFPQQRTLKMVDAPEPGPLAPGQVRVRTHEVGICGTDKEIASFLYGTPPRGSDFLIMGHECLGEVLEAGAGVQGFAKGDLVVPRVRRPCPHTGCLPCRQGRSDYCVTGDYTERGIAGAHGFACEQWVEDAQYLHKVERTLRPVGVLTEPLTIAEKALLTVDTVQARLPGPRDMRSGRRALVLGSGPVGLLGAMALLRAGYSVHVYARTPAPNPKAEAASRVGARYLSSQEVPASQLPARAGPLDLVYEAAGASSTAFEVLKVLGPNGVFVFTGVPGRKEPLKLAGAELMRGLVMKNQLALGTVNAGPDAFAAAVADLGRFEARWPGELAKLITHRHRPEEAPELLRKGLGGGIKHVLTFTEAGR
ncbi:glucose dehydrogenase [Aggregicoccus sp. 17bor-14]|uniref:glucose 1-dehydrogenase n=1 Tax=Myxococcaceae TaxID=31 RepID=UPI00129CDB9C|nr:MULTISPECIES: glucose 1-dehydrogenase [Myxococcaceae]MBF5045475.1 glucose 1-dehydrogenase [Simulacricoccus sp. 17bor-14]MRI91213.1 glucose dehydrogenase [Aggregicoccus sp. 17bor-14]